MKIDMHVHTSEGSPCAKSDAITIVNAYKKADYDAIVITNHYDPDLLKDFGRTKREQIDRYLLGYQNAFFAGAACKINVMLGIEIRLEPRPEDYLIYGIDEHFLYEYPDLCFLSLKDLYELCHKYNALLYQAHPFRTPCIPQNPEYLDGVEYNQRPDSGNNNDKLKKWLKKYPDMKVISGSDCHDLDQVGFGGIVLNHEIRNEKELAFYLKIGHAKLIIDRKLG